MPEFDDLPIVRQYRVEAHPSGVKIYDEDKEDWFHIVEVLPNGKVAGVKATHPSWAGATKNGPRYPPAKDEPVPKSRAEYRRMVEIAKEAHAAGHVRVPGWE